jgi:cysteine synthase
LAGATGGDLGRRVIGCGVARRIEVGRETECAGMLIVVMICDTGERYVSSALFGFD